MAKTSSKKIETPKKKETPIKKDTRKKKDTHKKKDTRKKRETPKPKETPKQKETPKKKKARRSYTNEQLDQALREIRDNGMAIRQASKKYGIPRGTLFDKQSGRRPLNAVVGHPPYLTKKEETEIVV